MEPQKKEPDKDETIFSDIDLKKEKKKHINNARLLLACIAGLQLYNLLSVLPWFEYMQALSICFFIAMAIWAKYNPLPALSIALIVWLGGYIYGLASDPGEYLYFSFIMAILVNALIVTLMGLGIREAWQIAAEKKRAKK